MNRFRYVSMEFLGGIAVVLVCGATLGFARFREPSRASQPIPRDHVGESIGLSGASIKGSANAGVVLAVFTDYQCPFCAKFALNTMPSLTTRYVDSGRVRIAILNYPLEKIHPLAVAAAEVAECAGKGGRFWDMHDLLFQNRTTLTQDAFTELWSKAGLDGAELAVCRQQGLMLAKVRSQATIGKQFDVGGTPTIAIGYPEADGKIRVDQRFDTLPTVEELSAALDKALSK